MGERTGTSAGEERRGAHSFARRLLSFVALWAIILAVMFTGHRALAQVVFLGMMVFLATAGLLEFYRLAARSGSASYRGCGLFGGGLLMVGTFLHCTGRLGLHDSPSRVNDFEACFLILFVLGLCVRQLLARSGSAGLPALAMTLLGLMYVPWLLNFIQKIHFFPGLEGRGKFYVLYFLLVTKFSDTGAYAVGSLLGRHRLAPRISPAKTWEGLGGAIAVSIVASLVCAHGLGQRLPGMRPLHAGVLGALLGATAVVGDLIESLFKREAGVKDSGALLPGIGGVLDLLDSLLFNAPLMYLYLRHVLTHP